MALASYNGERFIEAQIRSILNSIGEHDELVVSDDGSTDRTAAILADLAETDSRILILPGPRLGIMANFENALRRCSGEVIFLSDQDDLWLENKVDVVLEEFASDPNITCVVHDMQIADDAGRSTGRTYFGIRGGHPGLLRNFVRNSYLGAAMAFRASILDVALPIPPKATMHDLWIGANSAIFGKVSFVHQSLGLYRRHSDNQTQLNTPSSPAIVLQRRLRMATLLTQQVWKHRSAGLKNTQRRIDDRSGSTR